MMRMKSIQMKKKICQLKKLCKRKVYKWKVCEWKKIIERNEVNE